MSNDLLNDVRNDPRHRLMHIGHPDAHVPGYEVSETAAPPVSKPRLLIAAVVASVLAILGMQAHHWAQGAPAPTIHGGWIVPFGFLLALIATMPFIHRHWWEHNYHRVAIALGVIVGAYYLFFLGVRDSVGTLLGPRAIAATAAEYVSFIFLIGSLFIVSGGILIRVRARATPAANTALLLIGAILANVFGTTGASMLLIRPFLRMNKGHIRPFHVVFFILIVSNAGGSLTPIGDPPLFLGYLQGVPFWWVMEHCWPIWLVVCGGLLSIFYVMDRLHDRRSPLRDKYKGDDSGPGISVYGGVNLVFITVITAGILLHTPINHVIESAFQFELPIRELAMVAASVGSLLLTPRRIHLENHFNYAPIKEVGFLFIGIFLTMVPALNYLYHENAKPEAERKFVIESPGQFYFASGSLSAVLDNAPTYLTFLQSSLGQLDQQVVGRVLSVVRRASVEILPSDLEGMTPDQQKVIRQTVNMLIRYHSAHVRSTPVSDSEARMGLLLADPQLNLNLIGISMGAVLFGAMTYIGNGPNFMVKSIADHSGIAMPSFFGYLFKYAIPILLPLLTLVWFLFLRQ